MTFKLITVGIAEIQLATPPDILRTILGSCVGVCLYDNKNLIGGMAHIMLPEMVEKNLNKKKYADTAIPLMLKEMENKGANRESITAKIVGGATMFKISSYIAISNIGQNNIDSVRSVLGELRINIIAEDIGGDYGRTVDFYIDTGIIKIKCLNKEIKII